MDILLLTQYFPPELGAASSRAYDTAKYLKKFGHNISVLTAFPNYQLFKPIKKYKNKIVYFEEIDGIRIYRSYIYSSSKKSLMARFLGFLTFMISSIMAGLFIKNFEIVIASSPPFSIGISGFIISKFKKAKMVFEVRDLYPDSAIELGVLKNIFLIKLLRMAENYLYCKADLLVGLTKGIVNHFKYFGHSEKSVLITNGVNIELFSSKSEYKNSVITKMNGGIILINVGILGRMHSLETILEALFLINDKNISLYLVGEGAEEEKLKLKANELNLENVIFLNNQARESIPLLISKSDICIVTTKKIKLTRGTLPVKAFEYMACGKPIVAAVHGEAADMINKAKAGIVVAPEDSVQMSRAIIKLCQDKKLRSELGMNGKKFVKLYYSREKIARLYEKQLKELNSR